MKRLFLIIALIAPGLATSAQIPNYTVWQRLKHGDQLFFDSAIAVPPADFRQHQKMFLLLDKTNSIHFETLIELRAAEKKLRAELAKAKADNTKLRATNAAQVKQIAELKKQIALSKKP